MRSRAAQKLLFLLFSVMPANLALFVPLRFLRRLTSAGAVKGDQQGNKMGKKSKSEELSNVQLSPTGTNPSPADRQPQEALSSNIVLKPEQQADFIWNVVK